MACSKRCAKCKKNLGLEQFPLKVGTGTPSHTSTCFPCTEKKKAYRQSRKVLQQQSQKNDRDSDAPSDEEAPTNASDRILPGVLSLKDFLVFLGRQKDILTVEASITVGELSEYGDRRKRADAIVNLMWEVMSYRFLCVSMVL